MYDQVVERIATVLDDVPEIRSVLVGLEETGETPSIRIWIDKAVQPQQPGKTAFRREVVHLCVQVDSWSPQDRRGGYLRGLRLAAMVKQRLEQYRLRGELGLAMDEPVYQLMQLKEGEPAVHVLVCPLLAVVSPNGNTEIYMADIARS